MRPIFRKMLWTLSFLVLAELTNSGPGTAILFPKSALAAPTISPLRVDGRVVRDTSGRAVLLRGLNIETHNWAYQSGQGDAGAIYDAVTKTWRIGNESILVSSMNDMNAWLLTAEDMRRMKGWGANVIRLQVAHYFFESINSPGVYYDSAFNKLNEWISLAAENGLYVIVDLHAPYGGRQYASSSMEGKTLWQNASERGYVVNLWREIAVRTKHHPNVLYELMNEPYPQNANSPNTQWWTLAQQLVDAIRAQGATQIIVAASPLDNTIPQGGDFVQLSDSLNAIAYDFHYYLPYQFTSQQAWWMTPQYPPANYPYLYPPSAWDWVDFTFDLDEPDFPGATNWTTWHETFSKSTPGEVSSKGATHVRPNLTSWNNGGQLSFDNVRLSIDGVAQAISNHNFEIPGSGGFPANWEQYSANADTEPAFGAQDGTGNRFVAIPATPVGRSRVVRPAWGLFWPLPAQYSTITVTADVRGENTGHGNVFGVDWIKEKIHDRTTMESDIEKFRKFGQDKNVPVMCLEFGVISAASVAQGHVTWLRDFSSLLNKHAIHGAYHAYRGSDSNPAHNGFGIYQCWGGPAAECPADRKFEFVVPALRSWFGKFQIPLMLLLD